MGGAEQTRSSSHQLPRSPSWGGPYPQFAPFTRKLGQPFSALGRGEPLWATRYPRQPPLPPPPFAVSATSSATAAAAAARVDDPADAAAAAPSSDTAPLSSSSSSAGGGASTAPFGLPLLGASAARVSRCAVCAAIDGVDCGRSSVGHRRAPRDRVLARYSEDGGSIIEVSGDETSVPLRHTAARVLRCIAAARDGGASAPSSPSGAVVAASGGAHGASSCSSPRVAYEHGEAARGGGGNNAGGWGGGGTAPSPHAPPPKMPASLRMYLYLDSGGDVIAALLAQRRGGGRCGGVGAAALAAAVVAGDTAVVAEAETRMALRRAWVCEHARARAQPLIAKLFDAVSHEYAISTQATVCVACSAHLDVLDGERYAG